MAGHDASLKGYLIHYFTRIFAIWSKFRAASPTATADKRDQEQDDENKEQDFGNTGCACGDAKESECARNEGDDEKNNCPT